MLTLSIKQYWLFFATSRHGNLPHLLPMKYESGAQHQWPSSCREVSLNIRADPSPSCIQFRICHHTATWTLKFIEHTEAVLASEDIPVFRMAEFSMSSATAIGEGNGNPLQYSCLENPMDRGAWQAMIHGVTKSWTRLSVWASAIGIAGKLVLYAPSLSFLSLGSSILGDSPSF